MSLKLQLSATLLALASLSSCTKKEPAPAAPAPAPETSAAPAAAPATERKVLHLAISDDVKSGDPNNSNDAISAEVMGHIFEGLVGYAYLGKLRTVEPMLAAELPTFTDKNKTLTFKLRTDAKFQDDPAFPEGKGRAFNADDVVYSIKRIGDPTGSSTNWWMYDGLVEGFNEWRTALEKAKPEERAALFDKPVAGLVAKDPQTFVLKLKKPYPQIIPILAMTPNSIVAREVVEKYGPEIINHPVGTGAYKLKDWVRGSKISVERSPSYRGATYPSEGTEEEKAAGLLAAAGKPLPMIDEIQWDVIKEEQPRWLKFRSGQLDEAGIPKDNFSEAITTDGTLAPEIAKGGAQLNKSMSMTFWFIEFNHKDPVIGKSLKLRQALAHAFDRKRALEILYNNRGILADGPIPPALEGGSNLPAYPYSYDLEKAKKLLAEAGFPGGKKLPPLSFDLRGPGTTARQLGELLADNFAKIGVKLNILANSFPEALEKAKNARFQMMLGGWAADYPDPENFLQLWVSSNMAPGTNTTNFNNKEYDKLYEQIRTQLPSPEREKAIRRMVEILNTDLADIFFFHAMDYRLSRQWLKNYHPHLLLNGAGRFYDLDLALKSELLKSL